MKIDIEFSLYQRLTLLLQDESDTYSNVIERLISAKSPESPSTHQNVLAALIGTAAQDTPHDLNELLHNTPRRPNDLADLLGGAWFDNVQFANGTRFTAQYKGATYNAEIKDGVWVGSDGVARTSPSAAASAISGTNVNGWKFWFVKRPEDSDWQRMDDLRR